MARTPIKQRQISGQAIGRATGATGYYTNDDHPTVKGPGLGVRIANTFRKVTSGLVPGPSDAHSKAVGQTAYYNAKYDRAKSADRGSAVRRDEMLSQYNDTKSAVKRGRR